MIEKILKFLNLTRVSKTESLVLATKQMSGSWLRVTDSNDNILGWTYRCVCGFSGRYQPNEVNVTKVHTCACSRFFNLKQSLLLNGASTKIVRKEAPQRTMQVIGEAFSGDSQYTPMR